MICGGKSFSDIDKLSFDKVLSYISGIEEILDSSNISRYFSNTASMLEKVAVNKTISKLGSISLVTDYGLIPSCSQESNKTKKVSLSFGGGISAPL